MSAVVRSSRPRSRRPTRLRPIRHTRIEDGQDGLTPQAVADDYEQYTPGLTMRSKRTASGPVSESVTARLNFFITTLGSAPGDRGVDLEQVRQIFGGASEIQQLVISRAISGLRLE